MNRSVVIRSSKVTGVPPVNVNNEIGLDAFLDYTVAQHLEDLSSEGLEVLARVGDTYFFSDASCRTLTDQMEEVSEANLDAETIEMLGLPEPQATA